MIPELEALFKQFTNFTDAELFEITGKFKKVIVKKDQYLMNQGEVCKHFVFVKSGCIRMYYLSNDVEVSAWFSQENSVAMEIQSFISETPSICSLHAIEDSEVYILSKKSLETLYDSYPKMNEFMRKVWEAALLLVVPRFASLQNDSAEKRYIELLKNPMLYQQIPQKYLASFIGVTPTSLSRIRRKLAKTN